MIYNKAFFDQTLDRRGTACDKWGGMEKNLGKQLNPMWVADMDFRCPEEIQKVIVERAMHPAYGYSYQTESATKAMLNFMQRRHGLTLKAEEHFLMPCVITGLRAAVRAFTQPGDSVIILTPIYGPFYASVKDAGRVAVECQLHCDENGYYTMNLEAVEDACRKGAKLMLLCNPHNPCGRAWKKEELNALLEILRRYDVPVIADEIHEDYVFEKGAFTPLLSLASDPSDKAMALTSITKTFNLAGLKQAVAFCRNEEMRKAVDREITLAGVVRANIFSMVAFEAAYNYGDAWLDGALEYIAEGGRILREELKKRLPEAVMSPLEATYLGWINLRAYGISDEDLLARCREAGVEFTPGTFFGAKTGSGYMRFNLACPHERVLLAVEQLEKAIKG